MRYIAAQDLDVEAWFNDYLRTLNELKIVHRRNVYNFNEAGFRVGCMKGYKIILPNDVHEVCDTPADNLQ